MTSYSNTACHARLNWCTKDHRSSGSAYCTLCHKSVPCGNMGIVQLLQHAKGVKHVQIAISRFSKSQGHFVPAGLPSLPISQQVVLAENTVTSEPQPKPTSSSMNAQTYVFSKAVADQASAAELKWILASVENDIPFAASDGMGMLFEQMFPCSTIAGDYACSSAKARYVVQYGLAPYFKDIVIQDLIKSDCGYVIC